MNKYIAAGLSLAMMGSVALPVFANTDMRHKEVVKTVNVACVSAAVDKRETALLAGFDTYHNSIRAALTTRQQALKDAWAKTDLKERRTAIRSAWNTYFKSVRDARKAWVAAKQSAWSTFKTDTKACGPVQATDANNSRSDAGI